jgi:predicted 3-demethylubiquinone-9 3-methyltransferase (glyoxalase superfamily)
VSTITPCLWFNGEAEAAAALYVSVFPNAAVTRVLRYGADSRFPAGTALLVEFTLAGQSFQALNGGPQHPHTEAISLSIACKDAAEVDHYWSALTAEGGSRIASGCPGRSFPMGSWRSSPIPTRRAPLAPCKP